MPGLLPLEEFARRPFHLAQPRFAITGALLTGAIGAGVLVPGAAARQAKQYPLESTDGLRLHNVTADPAVLQDRKGLRVTLSAETRRRMQDMTAEAQMHVEQLAPIMGLGFANGVIEAEIAGAPAPDAGEGARGFVGMAFRLQNDLRTAESHTPTGHGFACARKARPGTNPVALWIDGSTVAHCRNLRVEPRSTQ